MTIKTERSMDKGVCALGDSGQLKLFYGVMEGSFLNYMFLSLIILDVQE